MVGEGRESFLEEDGPFDPDILEKDGLEEILIDIDCQVLEIYSIKSHGE